MTAAPRPLAVAVGLAAALAVPHGLDAQGPLVTRAHRFVMGTSMTIEVSGVDAAARTEALDEAFAALAEVDRLMSHYRDDSELTRVNREAAAQPVPVSPPLFSVLTAAQDVSRASRGAFDVTVGPLMKLWGFFQKQPHVPSAAELAAVRPLVDYTAVNLDPAAHTVRFARPGMELDLGGIAKGFAVELAGGVLKRRGVSGFIDAGGNQYFVGTPVGKPRWQVGIEDPDRRGALLGVLKVDGGAVATSSSAGNFFEVGGTRYGHLLDPRTLRPSTRVHGVTVVGHDATLADALTKAVFLLGPVDGLALAESFPGTRALIATRGADGQVVLAMSASLRRDFAALPPVTR